MRDGRIYSQGHPDITHIVSTTNQNIIQPRTNLAESSNEIGA